MDIAFSPCPNDTFIFHAMLHNKVDIEPFRFHAHMEDVESLNKAAFSGNFPVTKLSVYAYLHLKDKGYELLDAGAAIGYGCGPLLVAREKHISIEDATIAVPGRYTTACLLLQLWQPLCTRIEIVPFHQILPAVAEGKYDAGLIIHEGRFVYPEYGCVKIIDLGEWWETETGLPIPLGCIGIRKDPAMIVHKAAMESILRNSVNYALGDPEASRAFVRTHARELDEQVIEDHIRLYVNEFTQSLGEAGSQAIATLEEMARCRKVL